MSTISVLDRHFVVPEAFNEAQTVHVLDGAQHVADSRPESAASAVQLTAAGDSDVVEVSREMLDLLIPVLKALASGQAVTVAPRGAELIEQHAADMINVSMSHMEQILDDGVLPYRKVGSYRLVRFADVADYGETLRVQRRKDAAELTAEAQRLGLYD